MNIKINKILTITGISALVIGLFCAFNVRSVFPNQTMVVMSFNKPVRFAGNGIVIKVPFVQDFEKVDNNIKRYTSNASNVYSKDNKVLVLGPTTLYKITDVKKYMLSVKNETGAVSRIEDTVYEITKNVFSQYMYSDIVKNTMTTADGKNTIQENEILEQIEKQIDESAKTKIADYGLEIQKVMLPSVFLPQDNINSIYKNIEADRKRAADEVLNQGIKEANELRALYKKGIQLMMNEANLYKDQQISAGKIEAKNIYDSVYKADPSFYSYYKTIKMYESYAANAKDGEMVLQIPANSEIGQILLGK